MALAVAVLAASAAGAQAARLKDIARIDAGGDVQLMGYGLVVGLSGSGDSRAAIFTMQSIANMLLRMGVTVPSDKIRVRNAAAVMVVARLSRYNRPGSALDVTISSLGDAKSLEGGTLLYTPLAAPDGYVYASAQGAVSVGGFSVSGGNGDRSSSNYVLSGRIPGGAIVQRAYRSEALPEAVTIILNDPDYTTAMRVVEAVNDELGQPRAEALDAGTILVQSAPAGSQEAGQRVSLVARIEALNVQPDVAARVVVNEKTGTIIAGERVSIGSVAIAHGNLSVQISSTPVVSQPAPFSGGKTVPLQDTDIAVDTRGSRLVPVAAAATVGDLARALNALGVTPRDMISIFQALREAGALRAELRII